MAQNSPYKRGVVKENDPAKARSRVEFPDEDNVVSFWMSWPSQSAGKTKMYNQPDVGAQVHCLVDWKGEDGLIVGSSYSQDDTPPSSDGSKFVVHFEGGAVLTVDKVSGGANLTTPGALVIQSNKVTITADIETFGTLKNNGVNISSTHKHSGVVPGSGDSGLPK